MNPPLRIALAAIVSAPLFLTRDPVDSRLTDEVKSLGTWGKISHTEAEAGGLGQP